MKIEDIIKQLNRHIESRRDALKINTKTHLVLMKSVKPNETFKAYKEVKLCLYYVKGKEHYKVLNLTHTCKILSGQEESTIDNVSKDFMLMIFNWMGSDFYKQIIKGEYKGYETT